jgi:hypothetical protein
MSLLAAAAAVARQGATFRRAAKQAPIDAAKRYAAEIRAAYPKSQASADGASIVLHGRRYFWGAEWIARGLEIFQEEAVKALSR